MALACYGIQYGHMDCNIIGHVETGDKIQAQFVNVNRFFINCIQSQVTSSRAIYTEKGVIYTDRQRSPLC